MKLYLIIIFSFLMQLSSAQDLYDEIRNDPDYIDYKTEYITTFVSKEYVDRENFISEFLKKVPQDYFKKQYEEDFDDWIVPRIKDSKFSSIEEAIEEKKKFDKLWEEQQAGIAVWADKKSKLQEKYGKEAFYKKINLEESIEVTWLKSRISGIISTPQKKSAYEADEIRESVGFAIYKAEYANHFITEKHTDRENFIDDFLNKVPEEYFIRKYEEGFDTWIVSRIKDSKFSSVEEAIKENKKFNNLWSESLAKNNALSDKLSEIEKELEKKYGKETLNEVRWETERDSRSLKLKLKGVALSEY